MEEINENSFEDIKEADEEGGDFEIVNTDECRSEKSSFDLNRFKKLASNNFVAKKRAYFEPPEDLDLIFNGEREKIWYLLTIKEYDGKGIFIMRREGEQKDVVGLTQIVLRLKQNQLHHPFTIRDLIRKYVEDVTLFEPNASNPMNLTVPESSNKKFKLSLNDPLSQIFSVAQKTSATLYLQNKNYLAGEAEDDTEEEMDEKFNYFLGFEKKDFCGILVCLTLILIILYFISTILVKDIVEMEMMRTRKNFNNRKISLN